MMFDNDEMNEFVDKVRESSDIFSVISKYVPLKRKGSKYWGCCPFHNEKTPSFSVSPEKGLFYCFGCHAGGNVFKFISLAENISYFEAVKLQAERLGIESPRSKKNKSKEQLEREQREKLLININTLSKDFFHNCLIMTTYGETGRKYLESRGIIKETIEDFSLGFAPNSWDALTKALINKKGMKAEQLIEAGLSISRKTGKGVYDKFRNRVMIPIADLYGRIVAFGGRILEESKSSIQNEDIKVPKYLNSPETLIFNKGKLLFGLNKAAQEIRKQDYAIIVEGYMDVISVYSAGIKNVVASLGTAFTEEQARLLTRYTRKIYFCYDSDEAGQKATIRALPIILKTGAEVKVIIIPDGKDPDEYIRKHGVEAFRELISNAVSMFDYRLNYVLSHNEHTSSEGKINVLRLLSPILNGIGDLTRKGEYIKQIARTLIISEDVVNAELRNNLRKENLHHQEIKTSKRVRNNAQLDAGRKILRMAWIETDTFLYINSILPIEVFDPVHQEIMSYLKKCMDNQQIPNDLTATEELSDEAVSELSKILIENENETPSDAMRGFKDSVKVMKLRALQIKRDKIAEEVKEIETANPKYTDDPIYNVKFDEYVKINKEMDKLKLKIV